MLPSSKPSSKNQYLSSHISLLCNSYQYWCQHPLPSTIKQNSALQNAETIYRAPFALLSHNAAVDPIFTYANLTALSLFEFNWQELFSTPSRYSAEPANRSERDQMLTKVNSKGYTNQYSGIRITQSGRRFWIKQATAWNLIDNHGLYQGQAAMFSDWAFIKD